MKYLLLPFVLMLLLSACSKKTTPALDASDVPAPVMMNFIQEHGGSDAFTWFEKEGKYMVEFEKDGQEGEALYQASGELISMEQNIEASDLPQAVLDYLDEFYAGHFIQEAELEKNAKGTFYEVELDVEGNEVELLFDEEGKFLEGEVEEN